MESRPKCWNALVVRGPEPAVSQSVTVHQTTPTPSVAFPSMTSGRCQTSCLVMVRDSRKSWKHIVIVIVKTIFDAHKVNE